MAKTRKYTPSQLKWMAESLTDTQVAYLLEQDQQTQLENANKNAGLAQQPANPGMQSTDSKGSMKPQVEQSNGNQDPIKKLANAISSGKLANVNPNQIMGFCKQAGIDASHVAKVVKFGIESLVSKVSDEKGKNVIQGVDKLLTALLMERKLIAESIIASAKDNDVDVKLLIEGIQTGNEFRINRAGALLGPDMKVSNDIKKIESISESVSKKCGEGLKESLKKMCKEVKESFAKETFEHKINEYYALNTKIKNLFKIAESCRVKLSDSANFKKVTDSSVKSLNEQMSALKFAIKHYRENK